MKCNYPGAYDKGRKYPTREGQEAIKKAILKTLEKRGLAPLAQLQSRLPRYFP